MAARRYPSRRRYAYRPGGFRRRNRYQSRVVRARYLARYASYQFDMTAGSSSTTEWDAPHYQRVVGGITNPMRVSAILYTGTPRHTESGSDESFNMGLGLFKATAAETQDLGTSGVLGATLSGQFRNFHERVFARETLAYNTSLDVPIQHQVRGSLTLAEGEALYMVAYFQQHHPIAGLAVGGMFTYKYTQRDVESAPSLSELPF